jgi:hypothetical protein
MSIKPFSCALKSNTEQLGIAVSEHLVPVADANTPGGVRFQALLGVLWNDVRSPAPSYHDPNDLVWMNVPGITDDEDEDYQDDEDYEDEEEEEEGLAASGRAPTVSGQTIAP